MDKEITRLKELYGKINNQDRELFVKQVLYFREIMCSKNYTLLQKEKHFKNVIEAYFRCNLTEADRTIFQALADEFQRRSIYELEESSVNRT